MSEWKKTRLGDVISTNIASYSTKEGWEFVNYLDTGNITENVIADIQRINLSTEKLPSRAKRKVQYNSILYSTVRPNQRHYGIVKESPENFLVSTGFTVIDVDEEKVDADFLYFLLTQDSLVELLHSIAEQSVSAYPSIKASDIENLEVELPPLIEQKKIASILNTISDKMRQNTEVNKNLQAQAQAVFLHLFADNESVIPASIADVALNVTDGVHNTVHDDPDGEYLLLSCKNIKGGSLSIGTSERRINAETFEKLRRRTKLAKGDVLISSVGTVGELLLVNTEPSNYEFQRSVAMVKPKPDIVSPAYLYEALLSQKAELINAAHGAVQQCLFISDIAGFPIGIPTQDDLLTFDEVVTPMFDTITANEAESIRLAALRDALLPKLISGEIDVSNIDL